MVQEIERNALDLSYQTCRLMDKGQESALLESIVFGGIKTPLLGVINGDGTYKLLDGFKRHRAATICGLKSVPFESLGQSEELGIVELLRRSMTMNLSVLEQASFISCLENNHRLTIGEIAKRLAKSKGWVSMRRRLLDEISDLVREKIFNGEFPAYAYMYILRPFIRMNDADPLEVDRFVDLISGKRLSVREIERVAYGYFKGPPEFKDHIESGDIIWALKRSAGLFRTKDGSLNGTEQSLLKDLELFSHGMRRLMRSLKDDRLKSSSFYAQANLLAEGILASGKVFFDFLEVFYDRSRAQ